MNETIEVGMVNDTQVAPTAASAVGIFKALPFTHAVLDHLSRGRGTLR